MYPTLSLLSLHKMIREEAQVITILPWWPRRGWIPPGPAAPSRPASVAIRARRSSDGMEFPDLGELCLAAWRRSGDLSAGEAFGERLLPSYVQLIDGRRQVAVLLLLVFSTGEGSPSPFYENSADLSPAFATSGLEALHNC